MKGTWHMHRQAEKQHENVLSIQERMLLLPPSRCSTEQVRLQQLYNNPMHMHNNH